LTFRGAWGNSFRAPGFAEESGLVKNAIAGWNTALFAQAATISVLCGSDPTSLAGRLTNPGAGLVGWNGVGSNGGTPGVACGNAAQPVGMALLGAAGTAQNAGMRQYVNTSGQELHPETARNWALT